MLFFPSSPCSVLITIKSTLNNRQILSRCWRRPNSNPQIMTSPSRINQSIRAAAAIRKIRRLDTNISWIAALSWHFRTSATKRDYKGDLLQNVGKIDITETFCFKKHLNAGKNLYTCAHNLTSVSTSPPTARPTSTGLWLAAGICVRLWLAAVPCAQLKKKVTHIQTTRDNNLTRVAKTVLPLLSPNATVLE